MQSEARATILGRIRSAIISGDRESALTQWQQIPRDYRVDSDLDWDAVIDLLKSRLEDYGAHVLTVESRNAQAGVDELLAKRGITNLLIPEGLPESWLPSCCECCVDNGLGYEALERIAAVMTGATMAIAETGTLVLRTVSGQGRRALTLIPDYHLCIVCAEDVVATVPQAIRLLEGGAAAAMTFCSGPSATADIEMTRIEGVHGPRSLDVLVLT